MMSFNLFDYVVWNSYKVIYILINLIIKVIEIKWNYNKLYIEKKYN